jgi:hypothetical protein
MRDNLEKLKKLREILEENKSVIYYGVLVLSAIAGLIYAIKGYYFYQDLDKISGGAQLLGIIFTPFVLAIVRFLIVVCFGVFLSTVIIAIPLRRIKIMQFELEFEEKAVEIADIQDKQFNQVHFLEKVLKNNNFFIGKFYKKKGIPYKAVIEYLFNSYELFFNDELGTNLHFELADKRNGEKFNDKRLKRLMNTVTTPGNSNTLIRNRTIFGNNILMLYQEELGEKLCILLSSSEYEFTDFDIKIIQSLLEIARMVCDSISIITPEE